MSMYALMDYSYDSGSLIGVGTLDECKAAGERLFAEKLKMWQCINAGRTRRHDDDPLVETLTWEETPGWHKNGILKGNAPISTEWMRIHVLTLGEFDTEV